MKVLGTERSGVYSTVMAVRNCVSNVRLYRSWHGAPAQYGPCILLLHDRKLTTYVIINISQGEIKNYYLEPPPSPPARGSGVISDIYLGLYKPLAA